MWMVVVAGSAIILLTVMAAIGRAGSITERSNRFWSLLSYNAFEAEQFESLADMTASADAVVLGTIRSVEPGRVWGKPPDDAAYYATAALEVTRLLTGHLPPGQANLVSLELFVVEPQIIPELQETLAGETAIYFLRNEGAEARMLGRSAEVQERESAFHRLVSMQGALRNLDGAVAIPPNKDTPFLIELLGQPFDALVSTVGDLGSQAPSR